MTIQALSERGQSNRELARLLGVTEGAVRYHRHRQAAGTGDGRAGQPLLAHAWRDAIGAWLAAADEAAPSNVAALHAWLVAEHDYPGSLRSLQRYVARVFPPPPRRARRRIETPPGTQAQADWAVFPGVWLGGAQRTLVAFVLQLSHSRAWALIWSERRDLLAWLTVHNAALVRLGGVPATIRIDNEKTAIVAGAGAWGTIHPAYRRYGETLRFHIDACPPRSPETKGKVERRIRDGRLGVSPYGQHWNTLDELQAASDGARERLMARRTCPATGTDVLTAWAAERAVLGPLPEPLPEPFDVAVTRRVAPDCTVVFEGRTYSVPFCLVGNRVEIRGGARDVQILHEATIVATHPRAGIERIVLDPAHYEGPSTATVTAPVPLGRMGTRLAEIAAMDPQQRPMDLYAALAEVAR
ncbi:MAG: IS21 family transposase [Halofilum sp. (in: g-proteobacteria)]|nr:IS21 family transposase [Halofilum sp. (in: g-proteobacteria)]